MNLFKISRTDYINWCEDMECIVLAKDEKRALELAIKVSEDFKKGKLKLMEIDSNIESVLMRTNRGA